MPRVHASFREKIVNFQVIFQKIEFWADATDPWLRGQKTLEVSEPSAALLVQKMQIENEMQRRQTSGALDLPGVARPMPWWY
jgi:hypothetical protein